MLERLPDDPVLGVLGYLDLRSISVGCGVCKSWAGPGLSNRDGVWAELARVLSGRRRSAAPAARVRASGRLRRSGKAAFAALVVARRSHTEEARARFDACKKPCLARLRALLDEWAPLDLDSRGAASSRTSRRSTRSSGAAT